MKNKHNLKQFRPKWFYHGMQLWIIKYLNQTSEDSGETFFDTKEVHVYTKGLDEVHIRDTVCHEIEHVLMEDVIKIVKAMNENTDKEEIEEIIVRLLTPRRMLTYASNPDICKYLFNNNNNNKEEAKVWNTK